MTLISVKSKYGSCSGSCTGLININNNYYIIYYVYYIKEASFIGKKGWAVNSIAIAFKSSNLLSPKELVT